METASSALIDLLLHAGGAVALHLDESGRLDRIGNPSQLAQWLPGGAAPPQSGAKLGEALSALFDAAQLSQIEDRHAALAAADAPATLTCPSLSGRTARLTAPRFFDVTCARLPGEPPGRSVVLIADRTLQQTLAASAAESRAAQELTLTVLRTDAATLRQFLQTATSAVGFIRVTLRQPARTQESLRDKLSLLRDEAGSLRAAAERLTLRQIVLACQGLVSELEDLLGHESLSGDDLLPLALRIDAISAGIGATASLDEQRAPASVVSVPAAAPRPAVRVAPPWHEICEQRANEIVQRLAEQYGTLARLRLKGSALVPERYQRQVEAALEPLLVNAMRHGIETPELRLAVDKPATGTITVTFRNRDSGGLEMSVHDDGRGFDLARIERAAKASGLLAPEAPGVADPRELVSMVFRPGFTTTALEDLPGEGRGMALLRETLHRQGGNVSVATKPLRYTQFTVRFPVNEAASARQKAPRHVLP